MRRALIVLMWGLVSGLWTTKAWAHKASDSYLNLSAETGSGAVDGQWDIALRDLEIAVGLDGNGDGRITWGELSGRRAEVLAYALPRLKLRRGGRDCPLSPQDLLVDRHSDGAYAVLRFRAECAAGGPLAVDYRLLFELDPLHRGLVRLTTDGGVRAAVLSPDGSTRTFAADRPSALREWLSFAGEGVWHIWIGFDHLLFLVALLLPAVLRREAGRWRPQESLRVVLVDVVKVVTAFTVAHSITLSVAALGLVALPSRWVESAIAASVVLAALNNLFPVVGRGRWLVAFGFGLVHGFGFADVLGDLGLTAGSLVAALFGFNVGVEAGQLVVVAAFVPLAFALRRRAFYRHGLLTGGSILILLLAAGWFVERAWDLRIFS